jgi:hypothetical protein
MNGKKKERKMEERKEGTLKESSERNIITRRTDEAEGNRVKTEVSKGIVAMKQSCTQC